MIMEGLSDEEVQTKLALLMGMAEDMALKDSRISHVVFMTLNNP
jgi:hypothetical protein